LNGKVYVAFLLSDGDNLQFDQGDIYSIWKKDPARGTVPVGTSLSPVLQEINTPLLDWYYTNKTANDELVSGPCGFQFIYLGDYDSALLPEWCEINAKWTADAGFSTASVWKGDYPSANYDVYTAMSGVDNIRHNANLASQSTNPRLTNGVFIFNERIRDCQNEQELYEDLSNVVASASAPRFATGKLITPRFGGTNFSAVKVVIDRLNADFPGKYVFQLPIDQAATARDYFQPNRTWNTGSGTWDTSTANWLNSASNAATFANNVNAVVFGAAAGVTNNPVITLNSTVTPRHVQVKSTNRNYTLSGTGGIGGNTALILDPANTMTLTLSSSNSYTGDTTVNSGTLTLGAGGRLGGGNYAGDIRIASGAFFNFQATSTHTLSGAITGAGTLRQNGGSDLILTGAAGNTINNLSITGGRVFINNANAITASTATTITNNGILNIGGSNPATIGPITIQNNGGIATRAAAGTTLAIVTLPGPGTAIFNNDDSTTRSLTLTSGQTLAGNLTVQIGGSRTTANGVGGVTLSGILSGSGGLIVRANTNTLTLSGANTYFGDTTISNGILALSGSGSISNTPNLIVGSAATLDVSASTTALTLGSGQTLKASATGANTPGTIKVASSKNLTLGNPTVGLEFTAFGGGSNPLLTVAGTGGSLNLNSRPIKVTTTSVLGGGPYKLIAKSGSATVTGTPGTLIVAGSGLASSGSLSVISGELFLTLSVAANYNITNLTTDVNGTCTPAGITLIGSGGIQTYTITPNTDYIVATLKVDGMAVTPSLSYTFSNVSTNHSIAATFAPATTLYWDADSTTAGFGSTPGTWGTDSFWTIDASGSSGTPLSTTTTNSSVNFGSATLNYNNPAVTVAAGGVTVGNIIFGAGQSTALTIAGGNIALRDTATITVNNTSDTIDSALTGAVTSLTKAGTGILTLTAATNSYSGNTLISTGTLQLGADDVIPDGSGKGNVAVTGTLDLNTFSETLNGLSGAGTLDTVAGGTPTLTVGGNDATSTFSGVVTDTAGTLSLNKIGAGTLTLAGPNAYIGGTTISGGTLTLSGAGTLGSPSSSLSLSGGQLNLGGLTRTNSAVNITAAASGPVITNGALSSASFAANNTNGNAIVSAILTGSGGFTKSDSGTVTLSGANSYSGATTVSEGTVQLGANNSLPTGTALTLGTGNTVGTLDLATFNQTVAGLIVASTNDIASTNSMVIGAGKTLTVSGGFTNGLNTGANAITKLNVTGAGTFSVTGGNFQIGGSTTTGAGNPGMVDLSGLTNFIYNNSAGTLRVGDVGGSSGGGVGISTLILAATNTITALTLATSDSQSGFMTNYIKLGSRANTINANTINIGQVNNRVNGGSLDFNTVTGTLRIRNNAGTGRANMAVGYGGNSGGNNSLFNNVDLTGHSSDLLLGTLNIAGRTAGSGTSIATFSFDTGTLDATTVTVGLRSTTTSASALTGTLNLGGGTVTNGSLALATSTTTSGGAVVATNNITGGTVTITNAANSITLGSASSATGGGATAVLNLTGGSLTVAGNIIKGATNGVVTSILNLSGGTLDLGGKNIGNAGSNVTFNAESGTLRNVATINGTGGLTKTTADTLVLAGVNAYSGDTTISAGTLKLGAANAIPDGTGKGNVAVTGSLDLNSFSETINGLSGAGIVDTVAGGTPTLTVGSNNANSTFSGVITNTAGALTLVKTGGGTLTLSGANGYTGNTRVNAGTLAILNPTIATSSTVFVTNGAILQLGFLVTNRVTALVLNGVNQPPGNYSSNNVASFISGPGSLQVATPGPSGPGTITNSVSGNTLTLTWPAGQTWRLVGQTNNLSTGLNPSTNAWFTVPGGIDGSNSITINPGNPTVFYKLVSP
jgi:autotransporter-associated beta strand protein